MVDVEEIVRKLSKAQRAYLCGEARDISNPPVWFLHGEEVMRPRYRRTRISLYGLGLLERGRFGSTMFTQLGLRVRDHLLSSKEGE